MSRFASIVLSSLTLLLASVPPAGAERLRPVGTLTIEGIGSVPVLSFSMGAQNGSPQASAVGSITGQRVEMTGLTVMKALDATSPRIFVAVAAGEIFRSARLDLYGSTANGAASIGLGRVRISGVTQGGSAAADAAAEEVTLVFAQIQMSFTGPKGTSSGGWDLEQNKKY